MNTTLIGILFMGSFLAIVLAYKSYDDKKSAAERAAFKAKVALNPELYYVSQGGLIPDPIEEPVVEPVAVQE